MASAAEFRPAPQTHQVELPPDHIFFGPSEAMQLVRQRVGASYIQESMRFAVKGNAAKEIGMPPYIEALAEDHPMSRAI